VPSRGTSDRCERKDGRPSLAGLRRACADVAARARHVAINHEPIQAYAEQFAPEVATQPSRAVEGREPEHTAAFWLTLSAINFGSGWFPTLRKQPGRSGYDTLASGLLARFQESGPWAAEELRQIGEAELGAITGQDPGHELIGLYATSLRDLGANLLSTFDGSFSAPVRQAGTSAARLVELLGRWRCFADVSHYDELELWFLKRAQLAAADLARARIAAFTDVSQLTMFADNLVPHVLRLDGILSFDDRLLDRIERGALIEHGSREEIEIRACALHAVELIVSAGSGITSAGVDELLWNRGREPSYKAQPRHRSRCTAY
jgi:hypothetical protein